MEVLPGIAGYAGQLDMPQRTQQAGNVDGGKEANLYGSALHI